MTQKAVSFAVICRFLRQSALISLELALSPMMILARRVEYAFDMTVQGSHAAARAMPRGPGEITRLSRPLAAI
jgi:hypothetical protein